MLPHFREAACICRESMGQHDDSAGGARARNRAAREARPGSKEVHAQRLQQRKTRRREKVCCLAWRPCFLCSLMLLHAAGCSCTQNCQRSSRGRQR